MGWMDFVKEMPVSIKLGLAAIVSSIPITAVISTGEGVSEWQSLAIQVPVLFAFIIFAFGILSLMFARNKERDMQWQKFFSEQRKEDREVIKDISDKIDKSVKTLIKTTEQCGERQARFRNDRKK
jgi:hypothetical protein